jgi:formylglycine-generating enzyme required for sulfatase activity
MSQARSWTATLPAALAVAAAAALAAPALAAPPAPALTLDLGGGERLELVLVKAGAFTQGSAAGEEGRADDERSREVRITRDFYVGRYEVTVGQWARFAAEARYRSEAEKGTSGGFGWDGRALVQAPRYNWRSPGYPTSDRHPVTIVTYDDALAFTRWLSQKSGFTVTLPTEAQWEYAARGGTTTRFYGGSADSAAPEIGWFRRNAPDGPRAVGQKRPNPLGLFDTAGNVYEWCLDWYGPYDAAPASDPLETRSNLSDKPRRVLRGGSWLRDARALRSAARYRNAPGSRNADNGFRVVASTGGRAVPAEAPAGKATARAATPGDAAGGGSWFSGPFVGGVLCISAAVAVLTLLFRRRRDSVRTRIGPDGFTLRVPGAQVGQRLSYRYRAGGVERTGAVTVTSDPDEGVFVYTGERPSAVEYLSAAVAAEASAEPFRAALRPTPREPERTRERERDEPFRGYPSAY